MHEGRSPPSPNGNHPFFFFPRYTSFIPLRYFVFSVRCSVSAHCPALFLATFAHNFPSHISARTVVRNVASLLPCVTLRDPPRTRASLPGIVYRGDETALELSSRWNLSDRTTYMSFSPGPGWLILQSEVELDSLDCTMHSDIKGGVVNYLRGQNLLKAKEKYYLFKTRGILGFRTS